LTGQKPEVPGYCVKEKDLEECSTHADCAGDGGGRCVALGRTGERYCLPRSTDDIEQVPAIPGSTATGDLGTPSVNARRRRSRQNKNSSGDEIANVNFFTTISHTYLAIPKKETYFV